jgi:hypothetical protein
MFYRMKLLTSSALTLAIATAAYGGGYWLEFGNPSASKDPAAANAIALVRAVGCGEPSHSKVTATAEGLVSGDRKSLPLRVVELSSPGIYAIKGDLPAGGSWVLSVTGTYREAVAGAIASVTSKGIERTTAKSTRDKPARADIDALLLLPATKQTAAR